MIAIYYLEVDLVLFCFNFVYVCVCGGGYEYACVGAQGRQSRVLDPPESAFLAAVSVACNVGAVN